MQYFQEEFMLVKNAIREKLEKFQKIFTPAYNSKKIFCPFQVVNVSGSDLVHIFKINC